MFPKPIESDALVSHVDFVPTLLDFLNIKSYKGMNTYKLKGKSYLPVLLGQKTDVQDHILFAFNDHWTTGNMVSAGSGAAFPYGVEPRPCVGMQAVA